MVKATEAEAVGSCSTEESTSPLSYKLNCFENDFGITLQILLQSYAEYVVGEKTKLTIVVFQLLRTNVIRPVFSSCRDVIII